MWDSSYWPNCLVLNCALPAVGVRRNMSVYVVVTYGRCASHRAWMIDSRLLVSIACLPLAVAYTRTGGSSTVRSGPSFVALPIGAVLKRFKFSSRCHFRDAEWDNHSVSLTSCTFLCLRSAFARLYARKYA